MSSNDRMIAIQQQIPSVGRTVIYRTQHRAGQHNGTKDHPAIITRVWSDTCVNCKVLPDCGPVYDVTSRIFIHPDDQDAEGWFWPPRVGG